MAGRMKMGMMVFCESFFFKFSFLFISDLYLVLLSFFALVLSFLFSMSNFPSYLAYRGRPNVLKTQKISQSDINQYGTFFVFFLFLSFSFRYVFQFTL
jgi:hypothetical protein